MGLQPGHWDVISIFRYNIKGLGSQVLPKMTCSYIIIIIALAIYIIRECTGHCCVIATPVYSIIIACMLNAHCLKTAVLRKIAIYIVSYIAVCMLNAHCSKVVLNLKNSYNN